MEDTLTAMHKAELDFQAKYDPYERTLIGQQMTGGSVK